MTPSEFEAKLTCEFICPCCQESILVAYENLELPIICTSCDAVVFFTPTIKKIVKAYKAACADFVSGGTAG